MAALFVSHSSRDRVAAEAVGTRLRAAGFAALFVDVDPAQGIPAGRHRERELSASREVNTAARSHRMRAATVLLAPPRPRRARSLPRADRSPVGGEQTGRVLHQVARDVEHGHLGDHREASDSVDGLGVEPSCQGLHLRPRPGAASLVRAPTSRSPDFAKMFR